MKKKVPQSEMCNSKFKNGNIDETLFNAKWVEIINRAEKIKTLKGVDGGQYVKSSNILSAV